MPVAPSSSPVVITKIVSRHCHMSFGDKILVENPWDRLYVGHFTHIISSDSPHKQDFSLHLTNKKQAGTRSQIYLTPRLWVSLLLQAPAGMESVPHFLPERQSLSWPETPSVTKFDIGCDFMSFWETSFPSQFLLTSATPEIPWLASLSFTLS